jgi:serine/threonine protein kinase
VLLEKLGAGGLGEVWKARDQTLSRVVALKFVTSAARESGGGRELLKEARAASALNHPNIVTVFEVGESDHGAYMAMELVDGETLRARMNRAALAAGDVLDIAAQIAEGLGMAHAHGIVHRDLKPENIMLRGDGYVKVLDFGLAKRLPWGQGAADPAMTATAGTATGQLAGTFAYMSPEQARGLEIGPASDVFSFGIILHEMLAASHPFRGQTVMDTLHNIIAAEAPEPAGASPLLAAVVRRALAKEPSQRYADARVLSEVLQTASAGVTPVAAPSKAPVRKAPAANVIPTPRWMQALGALISTALLVMAFLPDLGSAAGATAALPKVSSVAVLSFRAPADDAMLTSFAQDLVEELSSQLARSGMQVSAQSAVEALGTSLAPQDAGQRLSVSAVFTGSLRPSGEQAKVRVELVDAHTGFQIWSDTLTITRDAVASKTAEDIVSRVRIALSTRQ